MVFNQRGPILGVSLVILPRCIQELLFLSRGLIDYEPMLSLIEGVRSQFCFWDQSSKVSPRGKKATKTLYFG